jgi:hypothetical protein
LGEVDSLRRSYAVELACLWSGRLRSETYLLLIGRPETLIVDRPVSPSVVEFPVIGHMRGGADDDLVLSRPVVESFRVEGFAELALSSLEVELLLVEGGFVKRE